MTLPATDVLLQDGVLGCRVAWLLSMNGSQVPPALCGSGRVQTHSEDGRTYHLLHCHSGIGRDQEEGGVGDGEDLEGSQGRVRKGRYKRWGGQQGLLWSGHILLAWTSDWGELKQGGMLSVLVLE